MPLAGLPCVLRPDQCFILTSKCPYISAEWYMDRLARDKRHNPDHSGGTDSDASSAVLPPDPSEGSFHVRVSRCLIMCYSR